MCSISLWSVPQQAQLSGSAKMWNSKGMHRAWLHPGASESQSSAQDHTSMLNLLVGITDPPGAQRACYLLAQLCSLEQGWELVEGSQEGSSSWRSLLQIAQKHRVRHSPHSVPSQQHRSEPIPVMGTTKGQQRFCGCTELPHRQEMGLSHCKMGSIPFCTLCCFISIATANIFGKYTCPFSLPVSKGDWSLCCSVCWSI